MAAVITDQKGKKSKQLNNSYQKEISGHNFFHSEFHIKNYKRHRKSGKFIWLYSRDYKSKWYEQNSTFNGTVLSSFLIQPGKKEQTLSCLLNKQANKKKESQRINVTCNNRETAYRRITRQRLTQALLTGFNNFIRQNIFSTLILSIQ